MHAIQQQYWAVRDYLAPVLRESKFKEHGRITPEEFVVAGDFLGYKFPVWSWEKGDASKAKDYLPPDKQYLVTRGVPCLRRATSLAYTDADEDAEKLLSFAVDESNDEQGEEWVQTHAGRDPSANPTSIQEIPDLDGPEDNGSPSLPTRELSSLSLGSKDATPAIGTIPDLDEIPDMEEEGLDADDDATANPTPVGAGAATTEDEPSKANLLQVRTYDVMITYDKFYQTPRIWLLGYDENRTPLTSSQIFEDVSADHALKTVTIEAFPHSASLQAASVHPCKHASVMKKVIERMNTTVIEQQRLPATKDNGNKRRWLFRRNTGEEKKSGEVEGEEVEGMRVDFYLVVFLKFIASIVPTIEVDSTTAF
ncbi:hypothetical protein SISNIDRAFT_472381 [Sistotremastrum niveocremeum HHB9708]|uniref:Autophagy-related protein 3 n=1 Tax=Sistotremastrum niveocremeum HHB9708 TaxID=1314777 RepID=A0A165A4T4_9AGAM|nr:hypothetical protein SISNIDRAFT_472381 [Sistotremastrum niveocremeum HHB9708]